MKKFIAPVLVLFTLALVSCQKEALPAPVPSSQITVEYRIYAASGHVKAEYLLPENGQLVAKEFALDRVDNSYTFQWKSGQNFRVRAANSIPSGSEVKVEIYVNGNLFREANCNAPGTSATAEGIY